MNDQLLDIWETIKEWIMLPVIAFIAFVWWYEQRHNKDGLS